MTACSGMGLKAKKHFMMLKQRYERKNICVGVENFLYRKLLIQERGVLLAMKQFRDNDTSDDSQSHREMMVQVQCGQDSRLPPVMVFLVCLSIKVCLYWRSKRLTAQYNVMHTAA